MQSKATTVQLGYWQGRGGQGGSEEAAAGAKKAAAGAKKPARPRR